MNRKQYLIVQEQPHSQYAEAYRMFRTNIQFAKKGGELKTILFTSSCAGEGKSVSVSNIAIAIAQTGKKVIVVDCDLHRPVQHLVFGRVAVGLTNILWGEITPDDGIQETDQKNLYLVASGALPHNPADLLGSEKFDKLLGYLKNKADYVVIDSPPVLPFSDTCILASKVDGTVLVIGAGFVKADMTQVAKEALERANGCLIGVIINRVMDKNNGYYHYYYSKRKVDN